MLWAFILSYLGVQRLNSLKEKKDTNKKRCCVTVSSALKAVQREKQKCHFGAAVLSGNNIHPLLLITFRGILRRGIDWRVTIRWQLISQKGLQDDYSIHRLSRRGERASSGPTPASAQTTLALLVCPSARTWQFVGVRRDTEDFWPILVEKQTKINILLKSQQNKPRILEIRSKEEQQQTRAQKEERKKTAFYWLHLMVTILNRVETVAAES